MLDTLKKKISLKKIYENLTNDVFKKMVSLGFEDEYSGLVPIKYYEASNVMKI